MSGALSIPFALLAAFNVASQRLLFFLLAYAGMWGLVISQSRRISALEGKRDEKVEECVNRACEQLQNDSLQCFWSFNAICIADAHKLATNEQLIRVADQLEKNGHDHPFEGIEDYVPRKDWLEFVKTAMRRPDIKAKRSGDYLWLAEQWPTIKGYPAPTERIPLKLTVHNEILGRQGQ